MPVRYALICDQTHEFEAWFAGHAAFDALAAQHLITCPQCGSTQVQKQLMAPFIAAKTHTTQDQDLSSTDQNQQDTQSPAATDGSFAAQDAALRNHLRSLHTHIATNAEYVGTRFADEALKIHYEEAEPRAIYGEASQKDVKNLQEEGVAFVALPPLPDAQN